MITILGAHSFLGTAISERLAAAGAPIRAVDLDDLEALEGAQIALLLQPFDPDAEIEATVHRVRATLDAIRAADIRRAIFTGTTATLGTPSEPATESHEALPGTHPGLDAMLAAEWEFIAANTLFLSTSSLLLAPTTGPGDPGTHGLGALIKALSRAEIPALPDQNIALLDVRDAASAHLAALQRARPGQRYSLAAQSVPLSDLTAEIQQATGTPPPDLTIPLSNRLIDLTTPLARRIPRADALRRFADLLRLHPTHVDTAKAAMELSFDARHPTITVRDTLDGISHPGMNAGATRMPPTRGSGS